MAAQMEDLSRHAEQERAQVAIAQGEKGTEDPIEPARNGSAHSSDDDNDKESVQYQQGVKQARAITSHWSTKTLWIMFALLYVVSFIDMLVVAVHGALTPYMTSLFGRHGLSATVSVVASIASGCTRLPLAKIVDIFGRVEGYTVMLVILIIGQILKAASPNVDTFFAGHVLYWVGHIGLMFVIDIMIADMTSLKNRMIMYGINGTPTIASTLGGPRIADLFYSETPNFRWAYGAFAIMLFGSSVPVLAIWLWQQRKAFKSGLVEKPIKERNWHQSLLYYTIEFDVVGIILIVAAFSLTLLPLSLVQYAPDGWATGYIIAMLVLGVLLFPAFWAWEKFVASVPFIDWKYLLNPTIIGSCALYGITFASIFIWNSYFSSYLQVVHRLSITTANHVLNSMTLASAILQPFFGIAIRATGNFKWLAYVGIPFLLVGTALLIPYRTPDTSVAVLTTTQVLVGIGSGIFAACSNLAVMAVVSHQEVAVVSALWGLFGSIGSSIGSAVASAMWQNILPDQLYQRLPDDVKSEALTIFGDIVQQMSYEDGTPERDAIVGAYADIQRKMVIAGVCLAPCCVLSIWIWRNVGLKTLEEQQGKQTRGNIW